MSALTDLAKKLKDEISSFASNAENKVSNGINNFIQQKTVFANPTSNNGQNYWSGRTGQTLGKIQSFIESPRQLSPIPTVTPFKKNNFVSNLGNSIVNIPGGMVNTISQGVTAPLMDVGQALGRPFSGRQYDYNQFKNIGRLGLQVGGLVNPQAKTQQGTKYGFKQVAGNLAETALPIATAYVPKGAGGLVANTGTARTLLKGIAEGGKSGAKMGGAFGLLQGLADNRETQDNTEYIKNILGMTAGSTLMGGSIGGIVGGASAGVSIIKKLTSLPKNVDVQLRDRAGRWVAGDTPVKPKGMTDAQWKFQLDFNKRYGRNPYEPVYQSDLQKAIKIEAESRVGNQVRDINKDKIPNRFTKIDTQGGLYDVVGTAKHYDLNGKLMSEEPVKRSDLAQYFGKSAEDTKANYVAGQMADRSPDGVEGVFMQIVGKFDSAEEAFKAYKNGKPLNVAQQPLSETKLNSEPSDFIKEMNSQPKMTAEDINNLVREHGVKAEELKAKIPSLTTSEAKQQANIAQINIEGNRPAFKDTISKWLGNNKNAELEGYQFGKQFTKMDNKDADSLIKGIEGKNVPKNLEQYANQFRQLDDQVIQEANNIGIDTNYLHDHVAHIWKQDTREVMSKYEVFKKKYGFQNSRTIPTYEEGIKMGLTPRFKNPQAILGYQWQQLLKAKNGMDAFQSLRDQGLVVPASVGAKTPGFEPIKALGFPQSETRLNENKTVIGSWYAPSEIVKEINKVFGEKDVNPILKVTGKISGGVQDIFMSGGIPGTPVNAWTLAQAQKEILAGHVLTPLKALFANDKYFDSKIDVIKRMQQNDIPVDIGRRVTDLEAPQGMGKVGNIWNKVVNNPTFQRFAPALNIHFFENISNQLQSKGMAVEEADAIAAKALKNWSGTTGILENAEKNPNTQNLIKTFFFAPKYRESIINFWANSIRALSPSALT